MNWLSERLVLAFQRTPLFAYIDKSIRAAEADAWDEGFDHAWGEAEKLVGEQICPPHVPGEGYEANPYRGPLARGGGQ